MIDHLDHKNKILYGMQDRAIEKDELHVNCLRLGENKGFHEVIFDSEAEVIKIANQTRDRGGFARGAIMGMKWLMDQDEPGYYTFDECFSIIIDRNL
jgi:4-hydroxy-tetrahydrodipicolinate reductase